MRAWPCVIALVACRQALGIPETGSVAGNGGFAVHAMVTGAAGASGTAVVTLDTNSETLVDGAFTFATRVPDGDTYKIVPVTGNCIITNGSGTIAGADIDDVAITCDGLAALGSFGFSAPLAFDPAFDASIDGSTAVGSLITQQTSLSPAPLHPDAAQITGVVVDTVPQTATAAGYGPFLFRDGDAFGIDVVNAMFPARSPTATSRLDAPAVFGYGKASTPVAAEALGSAVAADRDVLVVGAPAVGGGRALVFRRVGQAWTEEAILMPAALAPGDDFGASVAVAANTIVIGAPAASGAGAAYVFDYANSQWQPRATALHASTPHAGDQFGTAVAITAAWIVVGAPSDSCQPGGCVFEFPQPSGAAISPVPSELQPGDHFGTSVAASGTTVVIGAPGDDSSGDALGSYPDAGAAYVLPLGATTGAQYLKAAVPGADDQFGTAVAIDGNFIVIGAPLEDSNGSAPDDHSADAAGAAYLFALAGTWSQTQYIKAPAPTAGDNFGRAVAIRANTIDGTTCVVAIAAPYEDSGVATAMTDKSAPDSGAVFAYALANQLVGAAAYIKASYIGAGDAFGSAIALTPESLVVGAPFEDSSNGGWNMPTNESLTDAGAVFAVR